MKDKITPFGKGGKWWSHDLTVEKAAKRVLYK